MKKNFLKIMLVLFAGATFSIIGCSKDDTTAPDVSVTGATSIELSLNSGAWTDLGATANDEKDGTVTVTSDASSTNPNTNLVGSYVITYTATDAAGNVGTAIRTIRVKNDAEDFAGNYIVTDSVIGLPVFPDYPQAITVDNAINNRVHFNRFADYANNAGIYATKLGSGALDIPLQTAVDIGSGTGSCNIATHQFSSTSFTATSNGFTLGYTDAITAPGTCIGSSTGIAKYIKQ